MMTIRSFDARVRRRCSFCRRSGHNITRCIENKIEIFEINCQTICRRTEVREFKEYLQMQIFTGQIEKDFLRTYAERKCDFIILHPILSEYDLYDIIDRIANYNYSLYSYEDRNIESDMVRILENFRNPEERAEPSTQNMAASLENDLASAVLFYDMMMMLNSQQEETHLLRENTIEIISLEEVKIKILKKQQKQEKECDICYENHKQVNFVKIVDCKHEFCKNCVKQIIAINKDKCCCPLCRGKIKKIETQTNGIKGEFI